MSCAHCLFACTKRGKDMTMENWKAALQLAKDTDSLVTIGGGEPTEHPRFWEFIGVMFSMYDADWPPLEGGTFMVTNGANTVSAIALAAMAKNGIMSVDLSRDRYHDEIDPRVVEAFTKKKRNLGYGQTDTDYRGIRTVNRIQAKGRAKSWGEIKECGCGLQVEPDGTLWPCPCKVRSFGTVTNPDIPELWENDMCGKKLKKLEQKLSKEKAA